MAYTRLCVTDREEISRMLAADPGVAWSTIAVVTGRHRSTVQREVDRNGGRHSYRASRAQQRAHRLHPRRPHKLAVEVDRAAQVAARLEAGYSPAGCARIVGGISTETIYSAVYNGLLGLSARKVLRTRRHRRRRRDHARTRAGSHVLGQFVSIHDRPSRVDERREFGHWEGDLIIGARNASALVTLNERVSKVQHVLALPGGYRADHVAARLDAWVATMPHTELRSVTWDRGSEMAHWQQLRLAGGVDVYFADPHSPWQRGQNENANRQLRFWLPKSTDLRRHTQHELDRICEVLNTQPRRSLNWNTPTNTYTAHTAH